MGTFLDLEVSSEDILDCVTLRLFERFVSEFEINSVDLTCMIILFFVDDLLCD